VKRIGSNWTAALVPMTAKSGMSRENVPMVVPSLGAAA
jgi:hypothetical protein